MNSLFTLFITTLLSTVQPYAIDQQTRLNFHDTDCLTEAIYYEARGEKLNGTAVAYVVLNRAAQTGDTLCEVIHAPHQFSYYTQRRRYPVRDSEAWMFSAYLATYAQLGLLTNPIGNATAYNEYRVASWLKDYVYERKLGHLYFYRRRDQPAVPELVKTKAAQILPVPLEVNCNDMHTLPSYLGASTISVVPEASHTTILKRWDRHRREPERHGMSHNVTVRLSTALPFPKETSLSCTQLAMLTSAVDTTEHRDELPTHRFHHWSARK